MFEDSQRWIVTNEILVKSALKILQTK